MGEVVTQIKPKQAKTNPYGLFSFLLSHFPIVPFSYYPFVLLYNTERMCNSTGWCNGLSQ